MLLEGTLGVPQHWWPAFTSSYHCHSVDEHECTKDDLISCLFVLYVLQLRLLAIAQRPFEMNE